MFRDVTQSLHQIDFQEFLLGRHTTPTLGGRCLLTIHSQQEMKQRRRRLKGATDLHLSLYTEAALPIHPPPLTVGRNGPRTAMFDK